MFKNFEEFLSNNKVDESNDNRVVVKYRWLDYFNKKWYETKCEIISQTDKTAKIKLLEFGPNGSSPGRIMRVHLGSLIGLERKKSEPDLSWRRATDPDLFKDDGDDVNEGIKNHVERYSEAKNLVEIAKSYFKNNDIENASKIWCDIYDLYDDMYNKDTHNEEERVKLFTDFQNVMTLFTDDEVFGITDYLKKKHFNI
jgi:hypothetical protein